VKTKAELGKELKEERIKIKAFFDEHKKEVDGKSVLDMTAEDIDRARQWNEQIGKLAEEYEAATDLENIESTNDEGIKALTRPGQPIVGIDPVHQANPTTQKSLGELFVESPAFAMYREPGKRLADGESGPSWSLDLGEKYGKTAWAGGLKAVFDTAASYTVQNVRLPTVITPGEQVPTVASLMPEGRTSGNAVAYMEETTTTNTAAETAESGSKPEAALAFTEKTSLVRKIAVQIPVTDEALEDIPFIESYIDTRLQLFVRQKEDSQLLVGTGAGNQLRGLLNVVGIQTQAKGSDPIPDAVYKGAQLIRAVGFLEPTGFVTHPLDWQDVRLLRTIDGLYIWGNPSEAGPERIWGMSTVQTTAITQNTGLVGAFRDGAEVFRRTELSMQVGWINDQFIKNQRTILVEERLALVAFRPKAFCTITGI
jgi:HK97 family phage major capsid protein